MEAYSEYMVITFGEISPFACSNYEGGTGGNIGIIDIRPVITLKKSQFK